MLCTNIPLLPVNYFNNTTNHDGVTHKLETNLFPSDNLWFVFGDKSECALRHINTSWYVKVSFAPL